MRTISVLAVGFALGVGPVVGAWAQGTGGHGHTPASPQAHGQAPVAPGERSRAPVRITMEALHRHGGVPPGWRFTLPSGDPVGGRDVYIKMKCFTCHDIAGEQFPAHKRDVGEIGPDLTEMGRHHPAEYLAEAIMTPNAVIIIGEGYTTSDGLSRMPDYNDTLTIAQLVDLVAYLKTLGSREGHGAPAGHEGGGHMPMKGTPGHQGAPKGH